jgi:drug/metabolite transporter (DMT)-like permease
MPKPASSLLDPWVQGTIFGLLSAVGYTATNALLRSVDHLDPIWVSAVKALPTTILIGPTLLWQVSRGQQVWPPWQAALWVLLSGLVGQLGGNVAFQWALGQVGLAITVPLTLGGMIVAASILARVFLHEPITPRATISLAVLILAIVVLSIGAEHVHPTAAEAAAETSTAHTWGIVLGVAAGIGSGFAYAILNVAIRNAITKGASLPFTLVTVSVSGILSLGLLSYLRVGPEHMAQTTPLEWQLMLLAGFGNAISFVALTISLRLTSVVYVNALNATQAAMAAFAGVIFFREVISPWLLVGLCLTIVGLLYMRQGKSAKDAPPEEL